MSHAPAPKSSLTRQPGVPGKTFSAPAQMKKTVSFSVHVEDEPLDGNKEKEAQYKVAADLVGSIRESLAKAQEKEDALHQSRRQSVRSKRMSTASVQLQRAIESGDAVRRRVSITRTSPRLSTPTSEGARESSFIISSLEKRKGQDKYEGTAYMVTDYTGNDYTGHDVNKKSKRGESLELEEVDKALRSLQATERELQRRKSVVEAKNSQASAYLERSTYRTRSRSRATSRAARSKSRAISRDPSRGKRDRSVASFATGTEDGDVASQTYVPQPPPLQHRPPAERAGKIVRKHITGTTDVYTDQDEADLRKRMTSFVKKALHYTNIAGYQVWVWFFMGIRMAPHPIGSYGAILALLIMQMWDRYIIQTTKTKRKMYNLIVRSMDQIEAVYDSLELVADNTELVESVLRDPINRLCSATRQVVLGLEVLIGLPRIYRVAVRDDIKLRVQDLQDASEIAQYTFVLANVVQFCVKIYPETPKADRTLAKIRQMEENQVDIMSMLDETRSKQRQKDYEQLRIKVTLEVTRDLLGQNAVPPFLANVVSYFEELRDVTPEEIRKVQELQDRWKRLHKIAEDPEVTEENLPGPDDLDDLQEAIDDVQNILYEKKTTLGLTNRLGELHEANEAGEELKTMQLYLKNSPFRAGPRPVPSIFGAPRGTKSKTDREEIEDVIREHKFMLADAIRELSEQTRRSRGENSLSLDRVSSFGSESSDPRKGNNLVLVCHTPQELMAHVELIKRALFRPSVVKIGDIGYIKANGKFEKVCNVYEDDETIPDAWLKGLPVKQEGPEYTPDTHWPSDKPESRSSTVRRKGLIFSVHKEKEWGKIVLKGTGGLKGFGDAGWRYRHAYWSAFQGQSLMKARAWWSGARAKFMEKYAVVDGSEGESLVFVTSIFKVKNYCIVVSEHPEPVTVHLTEKSDEPKKWVEARPHFSRDDPFVRMNISPKRAVRKEEYHTILIGYPEALERGAERTA